jgi:hypothetical protein
MLNVSYESTVTLQGIVWSEQASRKTHFCQKQKVPPARRFNRSFVLIYSLTRHFETKRTCYSGSTSNSIIHGTEFFTKS